MTRVLLVGNGAREHALARALKASDVDIVAHMDRQNPGIAALADEISIGSITDFKTLPSLHDIDYAVIGPEAPLYAGISDFITDNGVPCVAPSKRCAMIETSKSFARAVLDKVAPDANPTYMVARSLDDFRKFAKSVDVMNMVVKPNGLTGGKGVKIAGEHLRSEDEVKKYVYDLLVKTGVVVLEEKLEGTEFTVQAFVDGQNVQTMPLVRDYKRAYDGDEGPNTGSMGSFSREDHGLSYVLEEDLARAKEIMSDAVPQIKKSAGHEYRGILYGQFMKTAQGVKVIEFNARFGDPEALNVLPLLETSFDDVCRSIIEGNLIPIKFRRKATVCVYLVPEGYPGDSVAKDNRIAVPEDLTCDIFYASVYEKDGDVFTTGSRSIGVLGMGDTVAEAREVAYQNAARIQGKIRYRTDIALGE
ncbi:MAG: phosphoribosylamine--glycine ligase [Candidatus Thorarchaeota archaeon]